MKYQSTPGAATRIRRRSYGDSFGSCLLMIVLVLGGTIWAYFHFFAYRELVRAGEKGQYSIQKDPDTIQSRQSSLEYQRHMREAGLGTTQNVMKETLDYIDRTIAGKYKGQKGDFEQRGNEVLRGLADNINDLNARDVPPPFDPGMHNLCLSHKYAYEAWQLLQKGYKEDDQPNDQKKDFKDARKMMEKAWATMKYGQDLIKRAFG